MNITIGLAFQIFIFYYFMDFGDSNSGLIYSLLSTPTLCLFVFKETVQFKCLMYRKKVKI